MIARYHEQVKHHQRDQMLDPRNKQKCCISVFNAGNTGGAARGRPAVWAGGSTSTFYFLCFGVFWTIFQKARVWWETQSLYSFTVASLRTFFYEAMSAVANSLFLEGIWMFGVIEQADNLNKWRSEKQSNNKDEPCDRKCSVALRGCLSQRLHPLLTKSFMHRLFCFHFCKKPHAFRSFWG